MEDKLALFEEKQIRKTWKDEKWYFSIEDVVYALTDSKDPKQYISKLRKRDEYLSQGWVQIVHTLKMNTKGGKQNINCADTEGILRIIQSIPSPKAEPFKLWLAQVGRERIEETIDPELAIDRALVTYQKKGYSDEWIHQRMLSIRIRNALTKEWQKNGVQRGREFAILTDEISEAWSGMKTRDYKRFKGLKKENLRDNMSDMELVLNMLAEATTTEFSKVQHPKGFEENRTIAKRGGKVAGDTRRAIEKETGRAVVTKQNAADLNAVVTGLIETVEVVELE